MGAASMNPPLMASDLYKKWNDGKHKDVLRELSNLSAMRASCTVAFMMMLFTDDNGLYDNSAVPFIAAMQERLKR